MQDDRILLAMKKRGFGKDWWNGYGGKISEGETIEQAAIREIAEEALVVAKEEHLQKVGVLDFYFHDKPEWNQRGHIYLLNEWEGEPQESEEMKPAWFGKHEIPYAAMWPADDVWIPRIITGEKIQGEIYFNEGQPQTITINSL